MLKTNTLLSLLLCASFSLGARGAETEGKAMPPRPVVLELFTSQGCSSCPPADALLGELAQRPDVIALAYHVDYWDYLGWRDPYSLPEAAPRQRSYARHLHAYSIFTPQLMVNGQHSVIGSQRAGVLEALRVAQAEDTSPLAVRAHLEPRAGAAELAIEVGAAGSSARTGNYDVLAVGYVPAADTHVAHGENAGRLLREYNIVRSVRELGQWQGKAASYRSPLAQLPRDVNAVAILVQTADGGAIVGATRLQLTPPTQPRRGAPTSAQSPAETPPPPARR